MPTPYQNATSFKKIFEKVQSFSYDHYALRKQKYYEAFYDYIEVFESFTNEAINSGKHNFAPFTAQLLPKKNTGTRLFLESSFLDKLITFSLVSDIGVKIQNEIDAITNDKTMPIPPAAAFLKLDNPYPYTDWRNDYYLWQQIPEYYGLQGYSWYIQTDLQNFFDTIDNNTLLNHLKNFFKDDRAFKLLKQYFDIKALWNHDIIKRPNGLPTGEPTSHLFANLYLLSFDKWVINQGIPYARYVDDMRFFAHSKKECEALLRKISSHLLISYNLTVNPSKNRFVSIQENENAEKAKFLFNHIQNLQKSSRELPYRLNTFKKLTSHQLSTILNQLKGKVPPKSETNKIPYTFGPEYSQNKTISKFVEFSVNESESNEHEPILFSFLEWVIAQEPNEYTTSLLRITVSKLSFYNPQKTANIVCHLIQSESYAWRIAAIKAVLKSRDDDMLLRVEQYISDLLVKDYLPIKEIKHVLSLIHEYRHISSALIQKIRVAGHQEIIKHIIPANNSVEDLIDQMIQSRDFDILESAAVQIYKLQISAPIVFDYWRTNLTLPYLTPDLKAYILIWAEFLSKDFDVKAFIYENIDHFSHFEIALFKESLAIATRKTEILNKKADNNVDTKKYTDNVIDLIENSFNQSENQNETYLF